MKFITEDDLRVLFNQESFESYKLAEETRLTPGARQFLQDRKIQIEDGQIIKKKGLASLEPGNSLPESPVESPERNLFQLKKDSLYADFMLAGLDLLERDVALAKEVFLLGESLLDLKAALVEPLEIGGGQCQKQEEDCFKISSFHALIPKGREILTLHRLRCKARELQLEYADEYMASLVNRLSQMICIEYGENLCQKKN